MSTLTGPRTSGGQEHEPAPTRAQQKAHALGLTSATGLVVGSIVGTGVFAMPAGFPTPTAGCTPTPGTSSVTSPAT